MSESGRKIKEMILDPKWEVGTVSFDGIEFVRMMLDHPRYGLIDILLPLNEASSLSSLLDRVVHDVSERRMS